MIAFGQMMESAPLLSDAEFYGKIAWDQSAPKALRRAAQASDFGRLSSLLADGMKGHRARRSEVALNSFAKQSQWSRQHVIEPPRVAALRQAWDAFHQPGRIERRNGHALKNLRAGLPVRHMPELVVAAEEWGRAFPTDPCSSPMEMFLLFEILRDAGLLLPPGCFAKLWQRALAMAVNHAAQRRIAPCATAQGAGSRFLNAELDWQAGLLFAPVAGADQVCRDGRDALRLLLVDSTDASGIPFAALVEELPIWFTSLVRGRDWGRQFKRPLLDVSQEKRFRELVTAVARLCRRDGRPALSNGTATEMCRVWPFAAASVPQRVRAVSPAIEYLNSFTSLVQPSAFPRRGNSRRKRSELNGSNHRIRIAPVFHSHQSRLACLRSDWTPNANTLLAGYHLPQPVLELATRGGVLLSGEWELDVRIDGEAVSIADPWECVCWHTDEDGDYLELQVRPCDGVRIERQLLLARQDDVLFLADSVLAAGGARIDYAARLSLAAGIEVSPETRTRDCRLANDASQARVYPLGLPCERVAGSAGQLSGLPNRLELRQAGIAGLYAPLVIDWNPRRRRRPAAWRTLTVAQNGVALAPSSAAGFRLQVGGSQWLVYHSLSPILEPRTVLGHHTMDETLIGRFVSGNVEPIVLVEQHAEISP